MNQSTGTLPDDEIDIGSFAKKFFAIIRYPFSLLLSNKAMTLVFIFAAVVLSFILKRSMPKTYSSYFIIKPLDHKEKAHFKILGDIQTLLKYGDHQGIASELGIDTLVSQKITGLQVNAPGSKNAVDSTSLAEVTITTLDYNLFIPFQNALLNYLENNAYFSKIKNLQDKQIQVELEQVEKDMVHLDSLKAIQLRTYGKYSLSSQNTLPLNELVDPTTLYKAQTERVDKRSNLLARSKFLDNFQLIKGCVVIRQATSPPRVLKFCLYLVPFFLLICVVFLHFRNESSKKKPVVPEN